MIYWLTGQPGAGKTTLVKMLYTHLHPLNPMIVDGDDIREIFNNKDYSELGRRKNVELAQHLAHFIHNKGGVALVSLVSPYKDQRDLFKELIGDDNIKEIYVHTTEDRGREHFFVEGYQPPIENFIDCDTTIDNEFQSYRKLLQKLDL
jgi:adenylylsulfate kinase-like enzyme